MSCMLVVNEIADMYSFILGVHHTQGETLIYLTIYRFIHSNSRGIFILFHSYHRSDEEKHTGRTSLKEKIYDAGDPSTVVLADAGEEGGVIGDAFPPRAHARGHHRLHEVGIARSDSNDP